MRADVATNLVTLRSDAERIRGIKGEKRTPDRLVAHFLLERALADRLKALPAGERPSRYPEIYKDLFAGLADHPQHGSDARMRAQNTASQVALLRPLLRPDVRFVEIGCGDAAVSIALALAVRETVGVDVTGELIPTAAMPANFRFVQTGGIGIGLESGSANMVYSNQLMEHLHPDDAIAQLAEIYRILAPGGTYLCITPNRLTGPHDISGYFAYEPCGLHLREYDHGTLADHFRSVGFKRVQAMVTLKGRRVTLPVGPVRFAERAFGALPRALRNRLTALGPVQTLGGITMVGTK